MPTVQQNAPEFFAAVAPDVIQLTFHNHEAVPPPSYAAATSSVSSGGQPTGASECWFEATTLFKPHTAFTRSPKAHAERTWRAEQDRSGARQQRARDLEAGKVEDALEQWNKPLDDLADSTLRSLRMSRTMGSGLWAADASKAKDGAVDSGASVGVPAGNDSSDTDDGDGAEPRTSRERLEAERRRWLARRERREQLRAEGAFDEAAAESDESDQEARRRSLRSSLDGALVFTYFHAHEQGKAAVRLQPHKPELPLPRAGIHAFGSPMRDDPRVYACSGPGAPVILHYANCGFTNWLHKYRMLTLAPRVGGGRQLSLGEVAEPRRVAHGKCNGCVEGAAADCRPCTMSEAVRTTGKPPSVEAPSPSAFLQTAETDRQILMRLTSGSEARRARKRWAASRHNADKLMGFHALSACMVEDALRSGDLRDARFVYERVVCMPDMLPLLASRGLLVEVTFPARLMRQLQVDEALRKESVAAAKPLPSELSMPPVLSVRLQPPAATAMTSATMPVCSLSGSLLDELRMRASDVREGDEMGREIASLRLLASHDRPALRARLAALGVRTIGQRLQAERLLLDASLGCS